MLFQLHKFSNISVRGVIPVCLSAMFRTVHKTLLSYDWQVLHALLQAAAYCDNTDAPMAASTYYHDYRPLRWKRHAFVTNLFIAYSRFPVDMLSKRTFKLAFSVSAVV